ncbi:MAG: hypothetical protein GY803_04990 [Chloroflexi bacterium]|nr:hypothetical protein [Chloroflexota bacterium]
MKEKYSSYFLFGLLAGALIAAVVWYWQKSTAADDGALELLDRMAAMERRAQSVSPPVPDDLQQVHGIGPVFDGRLRQAGVDTFVKLAALPAEKLVAILDVGLNRAADILAEAGQFS